MKLHKLQYAIDLENEQIESYKKRLEIRYKRIEDLKKIQALYPEAEEVRDYGYSRFRGYKFIRDKNISEPGQDLLFSYSRYFGIRIIIGHKIFNKNYLIFNQMIEVRRSRPSDNEYEINIDYEKMFDKKIVNKIDNLIIKYSKSNKIKIPRKNVSVRLQKLLAFS
jgi:hypothetical protein